ncbi:MAG: hypothetical protein GWN31_01615, partial [Candidatus Thorarchaeota archaeon]|nr:hypothetical protein [Candidatus Thorarchaeota archaeon]NIW12643.1 hypothetical protein [Candidatus Thorarchaeota archaeon]
TFWNFVAASKSFMENPDEKYFYPKVHAPSEEEVLKNLQSNGKDLIFHIVTDKTRNVPDILWGQLYKTQEAVARLLKDRDFQVLRTGIWSDEETVHIFIYELESNEIPAVHKQTGPPIHMHKNSKEFLETHKGKKDTVSGPGIEGHRWWVQKKRKHTNALKLLEDTVIKGENNIGLSKGLEQKIKEESIMLLNQEIKPYIAQDFAIYLKKFLKGGPDWLD